MKLRILLGFLLVTVIGAATYVRLAPADPAIWNIALAPRPAAIAQPPVDQVTSVGNGAYAVLRLPPEQATAALIRLDQAILATPRTRLIAGSTAEGHMTWQARSAVWGFPDYTTAQVTPEGLVIYSRQRFGRQDWGVNAARLRDWLDRIATAP